MVRTVQPRQWASWSERSVDGKPEDRSMGMKKVVFEEIRQMESTVEVGQSTIGNGSRVSF
jgi:hypothetical protein